MTLNPNPHRSTLNPEPACEPGTRTGRPNLSALRFGASRRKPVPGATRIRFRKRNPNPVPNPEASPTPRIKAKIHSLELSLSTRDSERDSERLRMQSLDDVGRALSEQA